MTALIYFAKLGKVDRFKERILIVSRHYFSQRSSSMDFRFQQLNCLQNELIRDDTLQAVEAGLSMLNIQNQKERLIVTEGGTCRSP